MTLEYRIRCVRCDRTFTLYAGESPRGSRHVCVDGRLLPVDTGGLTEFKPARVYNPVPLKQRRRGARALTVEEAEAARSREWAERLFGNAGPSTRVRGPS